MNSDNSSEVTTKLKAIRFAMWPTFAVKLLAVGVRLQILRRVDQLVQLRLLLF
jgi:hypothetical protein